MPELNTISFPDLVRNAEILFEKGFEEVPQAVRGSGLFRVMPIPHNTGDTREFSEVDIQEFAKLKKEGDKAERVDVTQGYTKIAKLKRVAGDIGITQEMRIYNKYGDVVEYLTNLGRLGAQRMELDATHRLTFAHAASYVDMDGETRDLTVGDGASLAYTAHPLKASPVTFSNVVTGNPALSKAGIQAAELLVVNQTFNHFGEKKAMTFDILFTTDDPETVDTAREYLLSTASLADNKNAGVINVYQGKYRLVVLPWLSTDANGSYDATKAKFWGIASSRHTTAYLGISEEPYLKSPSENGAADFNRDTWDFGTRAGYFVTVVSAPWVKISKGDGSSGGGVGPSS